MSFKARVVLHLHTYLLADGKPKGATPAFSTNRGVHCISMYTAGLPSGHPSCKQQRADNGGLLTWAAVRFDLVLPV